MTTRKKGFYYYLIWVLFVLNFTLTLIAAVALKDLWLHGMLTADYTTTLRAVGTIMCEFYFLSEIFAHKEGYTVITTTQYKLFKCRESGKDETFMMFADNEEELDKFFDYTRPNKQVFIEPAEMVGKSIDMKVFNSSNEA